MIMAWTRATEKEVKLVNVSSYYVCAARHPSWLSSLSLRYRLTNALRRRSPTYNRDYSLLDPSTCTVGCTSLPLDSTLYLVSHPSGSVVVNDTGTPVKYTSTASTVTCLDKFTRPVGDEGSATFKCQDSGGYNPTYDKVHACKPGCDDRTINTLPALKFSGKAVGTRSGDPPYGFSADLTDVAEAVTVSCMPNWELVYDDKSSEEQAFVCSNDAKGWTPKKSYYCRFNPNMGYPLLPTILLLVFCSAYKKIRFEHNNLVHQRAREIRRLSWSLIGG
eukprot:sb/3468020/